MHEDRVLAIKANLPSLSLARESWISFYGKEKICIDTINKIILETCNLYNDETLKASLYSLKRFTRVFPSRFSRKVLLISRYKY